MSAVVDNWVTRHRLNVDEFYRMAEVGLIDLTQRALTVFRGPSGGGYTDIVTTHAPAPVRLVALAGVEIDLGGLLNF
jgi:hypothetical protein